MRSAWWTLKPLEKGEGMGGRGRRGRRSHAAAAVLSALLALAGCVSDSPETSEAWATPAPPAGWPAITWPADNPYHPAKAELGRALFFDTRLSSDGVISCSWCHSERASFSDNHHSPLSTGVELLPTRRNAPTLVNVAFGKSFLLAGEVATLEEQAMGPLLARDEMNMTPERIEEVLSEDSAYVAAFRAAFGSGPITLARVAKALATYQRTLISARAPFDLWQAGDSGAFTPAQKRGFALFTGKAGCAACHVPPLFTDGGYYNTGLEDAVVDSGRARVTGLVSDAGKFKTPTLRNIVETNPYMHDGRFALLHEVIDHYNAGGVAHPARDPRIRPLGLTPDERDDLLAFLEGLTDREFLVLHNP